MANIFLIHGAFGNPNENWFPWLKSELQLLEHTVFVPAFPTPDNQTLESWKQVFAQYTQHIDTNTIMIGHSLGPAFLLSILEDCTTSIKAAYFVAGFTEPLGNQTFDQLNRTFIQKYFDWKKIQDNCKNFYLFHSDNDPYVPATISEHLAEQLQTESILIQNAGHFNTPAGYTTFPQLLSEIKKELT